METIKSLVLGSAAGLLAIGGVQPTELFEVQAKSIQAFINQRMLNRCTHFEALLWEKQAHPTANRPL